MEANTNTTMDWLYSLYPKIKLQLQKAVGTEWSDLNRLLENYFTKVPPTELILPIAACKATSGNSEEAIPIAAAITSIQIGLRILDDIADKEQNALWKEIGVGRASNFGYAFLNLGNKIILDSDYPNEVKQKLLTSIAGSTQHIYRGQDLDIQAEVNSIEDYWKLIHLKTAIPYSFAVESGAIAGNATDQQIELCKNFGLKLGLIIQLYNDLYSFKFDNKDLLARKSTMPLLFALKTLKGKNLSDLEALVKAGCTTKNIEETKELINKTQVYSFMHSTAFNLRNEALTYLDELDRSIGRATLVAYLEKIFESWKLHLRQETASLLQ